MAKSPIANLKVNKPQSRQSVTDIALVIPTTHTKITLTNSTNLMPLSHLHCDQAQQRIASRLLYLKAFAKWANETVQYGSSSVRTISSEYQQLKQYILFCDSKNIEPFSSEGYFAYVGNDGELWHQLRLYNPKKKFLFQYEDGQELGIKESTAQKKFGVVNSVLLHCKFDTIDLRNQCRPFQGDDESVATLPYHSSEQDLIIDRLSNAFFILAAELIAYKIGDIDELPAVVEVPIRVNGGFEIVEYQTGILGENIASRSKDQHINHDTAFNQCMVMAYHLICYFTSLNDAVIRGLCHPIKVESDSRDKSLKSVTISGYKHRAHKQVDAIFSNEMDNNIVFDVDKRDGVAFISTLTELSLLYLGDSHENSRLLYELDNSGRVASTFAVAIGSEKLVTRLHLLSHAKSAVADWLITCFRTLVKSQQSYSLGTIHNKNGRTIVTKTLEPASLQTIGMRAQQYAFASLSCITDVSFKNIILPLQYQDKDDHDNVTVSFNYLDGSVGEFVVPAKYQSFLEDLEEWSLTRVNNSKKSKKPKYLVPMGAKYATTQWNGLSPLTYNMLSMIGLGRGNFFIELNSSRFRKTTSNEEYSETNLSHLINLLQNELATAQKHYINGDPNLNKLIISQAIKVLQRISKGDTLDDAKRAVCNEMNIEMLAHDKWLKSKEVSNPNGLHCNGEQTLIRGKKRQRETNKMLGVDLPCSEFDMCYLCKSAKGIDEPNSVYKLISFTDVLKEALDRYPNAKSEVKEKIVAFENILMGASDEVYEAAINRFNTHGRHPRVSIDHVKVSTKGVF